MAPKVLSILHRIQAVFFVAALVNTATVLAGWHPTGNAKIVQTVFHGILALTAFAVVAELLFRAVQRRIRPAPLREAVVTDPPVSGTWVACNSPADRIPSHGTRWGGQSHAIDLVESPYRTRGLWQFRKPEEFAAFGRPILAPADATVVAVVDKRRDHRARNSVLGVLYLFLVEQFVRSVGPRSFIFGNSITLELADGTYAKLCHLRRGSVSVRVGEHVTAGQQVGRCGNSGNSTQPHLHFHLMDTMNPDTAQGIPFEWRGVGVPRNDAEFTVERQRDQQA
ncbi:M23 family metallopeptidase [Nocardia panacis]|uniref:M23 family metallopeptidase n=1 Tax=Nocardia panacis TaxID=2340916 RepID=UPI001315935A|nr:M23 family metallopeptidase [Nocardia panacis]